MGLEEEKELISFFVFDTQYSIIPTFHQSIGRLFQYSSWSETSFRMVQNQIVIKKSHVKLSSLQEGIA
jgi:hypothetical protein